MTHKRSTRADLHAFLLLDSLLPGTDSDIVTSTQHDVIYLDVDVDALDDIITPAIAEELTRCGVLWDSEYSCLFMFV